MTRTQIQSNTFYRASDDNFCSILYIVLEVHIVKKRTNTIPMIVDVFRRSFHEMDVLGIFTTCAKASRVSFAMEAPSEGQRGYHPRHATESKVPWYNQVERR